MAVMTVNDTHREKLCFTQFCMPAFDIFHIFTQLIMFYTFHYPVLKSTYA